MREELAAVVARAKHAPFYRNRLNHPTWEAMPFTTKEDLRRAYPFGMLAVGRERLATYHESSGTSGEPTPSYFTDADWYDISERFARNAVGLSSADTVLVKTPYSLVTTAHQMHRAARLKGALVVPADNRSSNMPYEKVVRLLHDLEVSIAWCLPTEALFWAEAARLKGLEPARDFPKFRAFLVAGEPLSAPKRRRIEEIWGKTVFEDYGSTETGSLGGECGSGNLHLWADRLYFEVYDEKTKRSAETGEGQLIVTPLYREAMPLIRYALEDTVRIERESCPCGSRLPVARVLGRTSTSAQVAGRALFPKQLEEAVYSLPASHGVVFWRARYDERELEIEYEGDASARAPLADLVRRHLGVSPAVRAVSRGTIVPRERLTTKAKFTKPRFLFERGEDWNQGIFY